MNILTSLLLCCGVMCLSYGINQDDTIITLIGAIGLGVYNGIYYHKIWRK